MLRGGSLSNCSKEQYISWGVNPSCRCTMKNSSGMLAIVKIKTYMPLTCFQGLTKQISSVIEIYCTGYLEMFMGFEGK